MLIFAAAGDVLDVVVGWGSGAYQLCPFSPANSPNHPPT